MKRRDFLIASASLAGAAVPTVVAAQTKPCPPPSVSADGGGSASTQCAAAGDAEADWVRRRTGPGVVWAHDFRSDAEVNRFRWHGGIGNDPDNTGDGNCRRITTDGITGGGCLELDVPTGGRCRGVWLRPFSPLTGATNGLGTDDPAAGGSLARLDWNVVQGRDTAGRWTNGYYAHNDYHNHATRGIPGGWGHDGNEFYIQFRGKIPASRYTTGNPGGKFAGVMITGNGTSHITPNQEMVITSRVNPVIQCYTNFGNRSNSFMHENQGSQSGSRQPGGSTTCQTGTPLDGTNCITWPADEWVTVLLHFVCGHDGGGGNSPPFPNSNNDTTFEMYIARSGETTYTPVYSKRDYVWSFGGDDPTPYGWNAFKPWAYMNAGSTTSDAAVGFYHRYDQIIFSRQFVPCPEV